MSRVVPWIHQAPGDLVAGLNHEHRPSLRDYNIAFLDQATSIFAGIAILACTSPLLHQIARFYRGTRMASMPFVAYGILNYLRLASTKNVGGSPVATAYSSFSTQLRRPRLVGRGPLEFQDQPLVRPRP